MVSSINLELRKMDSVPIFLVSLKAIVLGLGMFYSIKWHHDQGKKEKKMEKGAVLRASGKVAAAFVFSLVVLALFTWVLVTTVGLNLSS